MNTLVGTGALIRLILRRDRIVLPVWIVLLALLPLGFATSYAQLYPTAALRQAFAHEIASSPAEVALLGPVFAPTIGGLTAWRWSTAAAILIGAASLLTVIRHTRTEEETGRRELLGATVVGRQAALSAALIMTFAADLVIAVLAAGGLMSLGLPTAGSIALALSAAAVGWIFAAAAGVAAQVTQSAGAARGIVGAILGLSYLLRVLGDGGERSGLSWLTWLSPLGWMRSIRPFAGERWWIFALFLGLVVVLTAAAYMLSWQRDLGAGLLPPRLGPAAASPVLRSPLALAWRLHRGGLLAWTAGFVVIGAVFGYVAQTAASQLPANPALMNLLGGKAGFSNGFFTLALLIFVEVVAAYAISATLRLRSEEMGMRAEPLLATSVSRVQWASSHLVFAALGSAVVLAAFGLTAGLTYGVSTGDVGGELPRVLAASLAYLPAVWVLAGITMALFGLLPRFATFVSWAALAACILLDLGGELHQVSQPVLDISPFTHVPKVLLVSEVSVMPLVWLVAAAAMFAIAGLAGFRRRDLD
jgi:ABC-2 type transport system permease protein